MQITSKYFFFKFILNEKQRDREYIYLKKTKKKKKGSVHTAEKFCWVFGINELIPPPPLQSNINILFFNFHHFLNDFLILYSLKVIAERLLKKAESVQITLFVSFL